ncbi:MAG TPA: sulfite exporter TauE/SafE family protein [Candidatus Limnocylindrales bacterium]|nr:sulfite exporter TauE/SafE family protein [Candidatus Limnocylindrales bacterium]
MSRRTSSRHPTSPSAAPAAAVSVPAAAAPHALPADDSDADELHRIALERRRARMGVASTVPAPVMPAPQSGAATVTLSVAGMTCRSCEVRIAKHVGRLPGVEKVTASAVAGRVTVETSSPVSRAALEAAINKAGYELGETPWLARDVKVWVTAAGGILLVLAIAIVAQVTGITELAATTGDLGSGGLLVALLLGLAAGVSTCAALVGGLVLALSASYQSRRAAAGEPDGGFVAGMRPALVFVAGRIAGYALLGALLGAIGAGVSMPPQVTAILMVVVAVVMTLLGTRLTGLSPRLAGWSPTLPMGLGATLGLTDGGSGAYSDGRAAVLGAASFFLPCGFTQAVQIYALSTGSPVFAGAIMAVFAIGTAPGLLALAGLPVVVPSRARPTLLRMVGVVVIAFAVVNLGAGLRLAGFSLPGTAVAPVAAVEGTGTNATGTGTGAATAPAASQPAGAVGAKQTLTTYQDAGGYSPANVSIAAGVPTTWTIESSTVQTCAAFFVVPDLGIQMIFKKGANTIELPAMEAGTLSYTCSMGMYGGQITIVDQPTGMTTSGG